MQLFKFYAAENDKNKGISQYQEGRRMDAHLGSSEVQEAEILVHTIDGLIIQKEEPEKMESWCFHSIPNPSSKTIQNGEPYQGTVTFIHFQMVTIAMIIILFFNN